MNGASSYNLMDCYRRTSDGLWLRGTYNAALGCLEFGAARRFVKISRQSAVAELDDTGVVVAKHLLSEDLGPVWRTFGSVPVDCRAYVEYVDAAKACGLRWQDAYGAVLRQCLDLCVAGFGDGLDDVAGMFVAPMECKWCMVGERYMVLDTPACAGSLSNLAGLEVRVEECAANSIAVSLLYDGRRIDAEVGAVEFAALAKIV